MATNNFNDQNYVNIVNKLNEFYGNLECNKDFDRNIKELRVLYKAYPKYFSEQTIKKINSYKHSNIVLRNKKPLPFDSGYDYIDKGPNDRTPGDIRSDFIYKLFNSKRSTE